MNPLEQKVKELEDKVKILTDIVRGQSKGQDFEEVIRNAVFFDRDVTTTRTTSLVVPDAGGTFNIARTPDVYLRAYYRGLAGNVPFFYLS